MSNVFLHIHNVALVGGVPAFICDVAAAFPQFFHIALHINGERVEKHSIHMMNDAGIRCFHIPPPLTREHIAPFNPKILALHNISGNSLVGSPTWEWLDEWPTISWHHSSVYPTIPTPLHIFVSQHVRRMYQNLIDSEHIKRFKVIPPCIQTSRYVGNRSWRNAERKVVGKIGAPFNPIKYPKQLLRAVDQSGAQMFMYPGCSRWWGFKDLKKIKGNMAVESPAPNWWGVAGWLGQMSAFVYMNATKYPNGKPVAPETWCRAVTEAMASGLPVVAENAGGIAEQIKDMETGILVAPGDWDGAAAALRMVLNRPKMAEEMGQAAASWTRQNADVSVMRRDLTPALLGLSMEAVDVL